MEICVQDEIPTSDSSLSELNNTTVVNEDLVFYSDFSWPTGRETCRDLLKLGQISLLSLRKSEVCIYMVSGARDNPPPFIERLYVKTVFLKSQVNVDLAWLFVTLIE